MNPIRIFCGILCCSVLVISCDRNRVFEEYTSIPGEMWNYNNHIKYDVNIVDTSLLYNVLINLRHTGQYHYSNIFFFITTHAPNGFSKKDTIEMKLALDDGKWIGKSAGNIYTRKQMYKKAIFFPYRGIYTFSIQHAMYDHPLKHISDVGLRIEKAQVNN